MGDDGNPFRPVLGQAPPALVGRDEALEEWAYGMSDSGPAGNVFYQGPVGCGRTVLLDASARLSRELGWHAIAEDAANPGFVERLVKVHLAVELGSPPPRYPPGRTDLRGWLEAATDSLVGVKGIALVVDNLDHGTQLEVNEFCNAVQFMNRGRRPVVMAASGDGPGLNERVFSSESPVSFMRKAAGFDLLTPLSADEVATALEQPLADGGVTIEHDALDAALSATDGFALMVQAIGWELWELGQRRITADAVPAAVRAAAVRVGAQIGRDFLPPDESDDGDPAVPALRQYLVDAIWPPPL